MMSSGRAVRICMICFALSTWLGAARVAQADDLFTWNPMETGTMAAAPSDARPMRPATFADERRWTAEVLATGVADVSNRNVGMAGATVGIGYYVFTNLAVMLDFSG